MSRALRRACARSGSWPATPANAGGAAAALMASAKASAAAGLVAVSRAAAIASAGAPARPLLKCSADAASGARRRTARRQAAAGAPARAATPASRSTHSRAGTSRPRRGWLRQNTLPAGAPGRSSLSTSLRRVLLQKRGIPEVPRRQARRTAAAATSVKSPRLSGRSSRRTAATPLSRHRRSMPWNTMASLEHVVGPERHLLAPLRIEQALAIEGDEALDQAPVGGVRLGLHRRERAAEELRQLAGAQGEPGHHAQAAAAAALQAPEQVGVGAGVGDAHRAVGRDHLGLDQARPPPGRSAWRSCRSRRSGSGRPRRRCVQPPPCT